MFIIIVSMTIVMTSTNDTSPLVIARVVSRIVSEVPVSGVEMRPFVSPIVAVG
jgi:hypothetical protein